MVLGTMSDFGQKVHVCKSHVHLRLTVDTSNHESRLNLRAHLEGCSAPKSRGKGYFALLTVTLGGEAAPDGVLSAYAFPVVLTGVLKVLGHKAGRSDECGVTTQMGPPSLEPLQLQWSEVKPSRFAMGKPAYCPFKVWFSYQNSDCVSKSIGMLCVWIV